jgi:hypothetical protein
MLAPGERRLLLDSLRPPQGYALDRAIGTTFSLDLIALLIAPLSFTFFEWEGADGPRDAHPLALLEALRRYASRMTVFCQAGQISFPGPYKKLFGYLEESVVEVTARDEAGVFHPKVWLLRYTAPDAPARWRLLNLSRNLTFDRSWDTVLLLDGQENTSVDTAAVARTNEPLRQFISSLPALSVRPVSDRVQADIDAFAEELDRVEFSPPPGFEKITFWPLGISDETRSPFGGRKDRLLIVSPFLSEGCLNHLISGTRESILISRAEELAVCPREVLQKFADVYALSPDAEPEEGEAPIRETLSGLHAKLYVADAGWRDRVWTGSANATIAALRQNVEFLIELEGKKSDCGIDRFLDSGAGKNSLLSLVDPFDVSQPRTGPDPVQRKFDAVLNRVRRGLARAALVANVTPHTVPDAPEVYSVSLKLPEGGAAAPFSPAAVTDGVEIETLECWPLTRPAADAEAVEYQGWPDVILPRFGPMTIESLTSFFAFRLTAMVTISVKKEGVGAGSQERSFHRTSTFVLNIPLQNAPADRPQRLLRSMLSSRQDLMRFLQLLLAGEGTDASQLLLAMRVRNDNNANEAETGAGGGFEMPVFEAMVRALDRDASKLDDIHRLLADLSKDDGLAILPPGFEEVWAPIWAVREQMLTQAAGSKPEVEYDKV